MAPIDGISTHRQYLGNGRFTYGLGPGGITGASGGSSSGSNSVSGSGFSLTSPVVTGLGAGAARAFSPAEYTFRDGFKDTMQEAQGSAGRISTRIFLSEATNRLVGDTPVRALASGGITSAAASASQALNYSDILGLRPGASVAENLAQLKPGTMLRSFRNITPGDYFKRTVWHANVDDIANIRNQVGSGLGRVVGLGLTGLDLAKDTHTGYLNARDRYDDGTAMGKLKTFAATGKTFVIQAAKSLASWELAGLAFHIGKSFFPAGNILGTVAGIALGALSAGTLNHQINKLLPDPERPSQGQGQGSGQSFPDSPQLQNVII